MGSAILIGTEVGGLLSEEAIDLYTIFRRLVDTKTS
jgi:hypothetical protein